MGRYAFERLAEATAPTLDDVAAGLGRARTSVAQEVETLERWGLLTRRGERITGALGLTVEPTPYRLELNGRPLHTWCALDAVGIRAALGADAQVEGPLDRDGVVRVELRQGKLVAAAPPDVRITLPDPSMEASVRETVCPRIAFQREAQAPRHESVALLTVAQAVQLGRRIWAGPSPVSGAHCC